VVEADRVEKAKELAAPRIIIRPRAVNEVDFVVKIEGGSYGNVYRVLGAKPERWVQQTDFENEEAVGFLADRLAKLGIENELFKVGAVAGSTVLIGKGHGMEFDWEPTLTSTAELMMAPRGTDPRLLRGDDRPTHLTRRQQYLDRMDAKSAARAELEAEREAGIWNDDEGFAVAPAAGQADAEDAASD
jgi:GTP-binding protein